MNITSQQLRQALDIQERIEALQVQLMDTLQPPATGTVSNGSRTQAVKAPNRATQPRRAMSAEARRRIAAAQRARWKKHRAEMVATAQ